jgi:hypothetical protein
MIKREERDRIYQEVGRHVIVLIRKLTSEEWEAKYGS